MATQETEYNWENYCDDVAEKDDTWQVMLPQMKQEIFNQFGDPNPSLSKIYEYWRQRVEIEWHRYAMLEWLFARTGRPYNTVLDAQGLRQCSEFHLEGCLKASNDQQCDLMEGILIEPDKYTCFVCTDSIQMGDFWFGENQYCCKRCWESGML